MASTPIRIARAIGLTILLAGCGDGRNESRASASADAAADFESPSAAPVAAVAGTSGRRAEGNLQSPEGPAVGRVVLEEQGGGTRMELTMSGVAAGAEMQASIVGGSCARPGREIEQGTVVFQTGAAGDARVEENLPMDIGELLDDRHSVRIMAPEETSHQGTDAASRPTFACAELSAG